MAFKIERRDASERLTQIKGWEAKGFDYWMQRLTDCKQRRRNADSFTAAERAAADYAVAEIAVARLSERLSLKVCD